LHFRINFLQSLQLHIAVGSPVSPKETDNHRTLSKQLFRRYLDMILVK
jgi:hypothetical protein